MKKYNKSIKHTVSGLFMSLILLSFFGCTPSQPSPAVIEKAKIETLNILDSLEQNENKIIGAVNIKSEFFDPDEAQYVINYQIETGIDSAHIVETEASAFIEKNKDFWKYSFVFDQTYTDTLYEQ